MSRTGNEAKELRDGVEEIEDLRHEDEQHRLAEVAEDGDDGERHSGKVAERIANKHARRIPDMTTQ